MVIGNYNLFQVFLMQIVIFFFFILIIFFKFLEGAISYNSYKNIFPIWALSRYIKLYS